MAAELGLYLGREQSYIKHHFLTQYLQAAAYKTLQGRSSTFNFVDAFAGPWRTSDKDYSDASFDQALRTIEAVRADLGRRGISGLKVRFCFCERRPEAVKHLKAYAETNRGFEIHVFPGSFEDNLQGIADACTDGFTFTFIDPTGWDIRSEPVFEFLKGQRGEFLLNFMAEHVNRHAGYDQVSASFGRFLADPDWKGDFDALPIGASNEEKILWLLKRKIKRIGAAKFLPDIPILKPREDRIKMRLILGTYSPRGLEVFRDVHSKVELSEIEMRHSISETETGQLGIWSQTDESKQHQRFAGVGSDRQKVGARSTIQKALAKGPLRFDVLAARVMEPWAMRLTHTKDLLIVMRQEGLVTFDLPDRAKKPQPDTQIRVCV